MARAPETPPVRVWLTHCWRADDDVADADILNIGGDEDLEGSSTQSPEPLAMSRLKYGTGMRINAALKVLAEKRSKRHQRKEEVLYLRADQTS